MTWLTSTLHAVGLRVGLYTDAGREGCGGALEGSYGHYQQDVNTFAAWGFDAVKVDFCGGVRQHLDPRGAYTAFHNAIVHDTPRRPMLLSICDYLEPGQSEGAPAFGGSAFSSYTFGPSVGNSWRTDTDVGAPGYVVFPTVLRNLDADATHPEAAGPGHWNDPDYLGPDQGMTDAQFRTQLSMWAMLAAPLMISDNLMTMTPASLEAVSNREVIAIDQDPAGIQGTLLVIRRRRPGVGQAAERRIARGSAAQPQSEPPGRSPRAPRRQAWRPRGATRCATCGLTPPPPRPARSPRKCPANRLCCCASRHGRRACLPAVRVAPSIPDERAVPMALGFYFAPQSFTVEQYDEAIRRLDAAGAGSPPGSLVSLRVLRQRRAARL